MWRSLGVRPARGVRSLAAAIFLALPPATGWTDSGSDAFARQDYVRAVELWRVEAADGSVEAKFGLGLIHDLGLGMPRNSAIALRWYLEAAVDGSADAQFNVAVMLDAGTGTPPDPAAAAMWYARAAANGNARAQYNLGLLYEHGIGVPRNPALARIWYEAAGATIPAAADRLAQVPRSEPSPGLPPKPVVGSIVGSIEAPRAELVWTAEYGRGEFRVQVARETGEQSGAATDMPDLLLSQDVEGSAVILDLPTGETYLKWRVGYISTDDDTSMWSSWMELSRDWNPQNAPPGPEGAPNRVTILVNVGDHLAMSFAEEISEVFTRGGVDVTVRNAEQPASTTTVEYRHSSDAAFAASVAGLLPVLRPDSAIQVLELDTALGEVTLRLVGGPQPLTQLED